ncbi:MAG: hypothetical protein EXS14_02580 [Planctomycetes bacterium]|nr:hypothetical protein [Planctomycetota bacterium]
MKILQITITGVALLAGGLVAQTGHVSESVEFSTRLAAHGYFDIAESVIAQVQAGGIGAADKADLDFALGTIKAEQGRKGSDLMLRVQRLQEAAAGFELWLTANAEHKRAGELRFQIADLYRVAGETAVAQLKNESDKTKQDKVRNDGLKCFTKALNLTERRVADLSTVETPSEAEKQELMALRFAVGKLNYSQALIFENRRGASAQTCLASAKEILENFEIDYSGELLGFEARRVLGQIAVEEGRMDEALELFSESCAQLMDAITGAPDIVEDEAVRELVGTTFLEKAQFELVQKKNPAAAMKTVDDIDKLMPALVLTRDGRNALLLCASVANDDGNSGKARDIAKRVLDADKYGPWGLRAQEMLDKLGGGEGNAGLATAFEAALMQRDIGRSEKLAGRLLNRKDSTREEFAHTVYLLGELYAETGRAVEASVCFDIVSEDYRDTKDAPTAKLAQAQAYANAARNDTGNFWRVRSVAARNDLTTKFADSDEAKEVAYVNALSLENDRKFPEALEQYQRVPASSPKYGDAMRRVGRIALEQAIAFSNRSQNDEAKKSFGVSLRALDAAVKTLTRIADRTLNDTDKQRLLREAVTAQLMLAGLHLQPLVKQPQLTLDALIVAEKLGGTDKDVIRKVWDLRIKAFTQMNKGKEAGALLEKFLAEAEKQGIKGAVAEAALSVAAALDNEAYQMAVGVPDKPEAMELWAEALKFYGRAVDEARRGGTTKRDAFEKVAGRLLALTAKAAKLPEGLPFTGIEPEKRKEFLENFARVLQAYEIVGTETSTDVNLDKQRNLARVSALMGKWTDAFAALQAITDAFPLYKKDEAGNDKLDTELLKKFTELPGIYQDLAACGIRAGIASKEDFYFQRSKMVLMQLLSVASANGKLWWECRYEHLRALYLSGDFTNFKVTLESLERSSENFDENKFGIQNKILALKKQAGDKIVNK